MAVAGIAVSALTTSHGARALPAATGNAAAATAVGTTPVAGWNGAKAETVQMKTTITFVAQKVVAFGLSALVAFNLRGRRIGIPLEGMDVAVPAAT